MLSMHVALARAALSYADQTAAQKHKKGAPSDGLSPQHMLPQTGHGCQASSSASCRFAYGAELGKQYGCTASAAFCPSALVCRFVPLLRTKQE